MDFVGHSYRYIYLSIKVLRSNEMVCVSSKTNLDACEIKSSQTSKVVIRHEPLTPLSQLVIPEYDLKITADIYSEKVGYEGLCIKVMQISFLKR